MKDIVAGDPGKTTKQTGPPRQWALALRPFGYLLVGLIWLAIWATVFTLAWGILGYGVVSGELTVSEFTDPTSSSAPSTGGMLLLAVLLALIMGPLVLWWLPNCSWPLAALSFVYVARSLRPSYRGEKLSFTAYSLSDTTFDTPTISNTALSLQPVRNTAVTRFLMRFYAAGWEPSGMGFLAMVPAGFGWLMLYPAIAVDVSPTANLVFGVLGLGLIAWSYIWVLRAMWAPAKDSRRTGKR